MLSRRELVVAGLAAPTLAAAEAFPSRTITVIVPFAPGASSDGVARIVGEGLSNRLGKSVIVDNRAGGGGSIGLMALARSAPDGYTFGIGATGGIAISPHVPGGAQGFDPLRELTPVAKLVDVPLVLVANPKTGLKTLADVIAASRAVPAGLNFGSTGVNSSQHLAIEVLKRLTGANLVHVAYRGSAPAVTDALGGQIPLASVDFTTALEHIRVGSLVPIAVLGSARVPFAPEIPTVAESGLPGFDISAWLGLFGPVGLPPEILARIVSDVKGILASPVAQTKIGGLSLVPTFFEPGPFATYLATESAKMRDILVTLGTTKG